MLEIKIKGATLLGLIMVVFTASTCQLTKHNEDALLSVYFLDGIYFLVLSLFVITDILSIKASKPIKTVILIGFLSRIFLLLWAIYGIDGAFHSFLNTGDQSGFLHTSLSYFNGDFSFFYTTYPFVINFIFQIFGPYRLMVQMINVLFWFWGVKIIINTAGNILYGRTCQYLIAFYCLLPNEMMLTVAVLRESMLAVFIMLSLRELLKWQDTGKKKYVFTAFFYAVPSIILHTGHISIWLTIFLVYEFWNPKKQKWKKLSSKTMVFLILALFSVPIYKNIIQLFPGYLPSTLSLETISGRAFDTARADYVTDSMVSNNLPQFLWYTLYRMFYFWVSPTPRLWTSMLDVAGFVFDTLPWLFFLLGYYRQIKRKKNKKGGTAIILFLAFTFIYAWGTRNAGTAMRHRDELVGPMVMLMLHGMKMITRSHLRMLKIDG